MKIHQMKIFVFRQIQHSLIPMSIRGLYSLIQFKFTIACLKIHQMRIFVLWKIQHSLIPMSIWGLYSLIQLKFTLACLNSKFYHFFSTTY